MAGFVAIMRKDRRPQFPNLSNAMLRSLRPFGMARSNLVEHDRFTLMWVQDDGYTPQDRLERQPVVTHNRWHLLFVGFLMHRDDLARALAIPSVQEARLTDSALAMCAWQRWGEDCVEYLVGPFSMVVCDTQSDRIFAARSQDRGPAIFVHDNDERVLLATTTKPIFCDPGVPKAIDELRLADALILNHEDKTRSYFKGIDLVPCGYVLNADPVGHALRRYYSLERVQPVSFPRDADYIEAARELLGKAVRSAMRACVTPAISLSAGLDSSTVAIAMLDELSADELPVKAFTAVPAVFWDGRSRSGWSGDESGPVRALAERYPGIDVEFVACDDLPFDHGVDLAQSYADMPLRGLDNNVWGREIARRCRRSGRQVILTGSSGNAALSLSAGDIILGQHFRERRWGKFLREHHLMMRGRECGLASYMSKLLARILIPNAPDWLYDRYLRSRGSDLIDGFRSFSGINPDYAREMKLDQRLRDLGWDDRYRRPRSRRQLMRLMSERGGRDNGSAMSEAFTAMDGVQRRDPLGDRRIVEFCYAIPDEQFFGEGQDRRLIRRMMAAKLPPQLLEAPRGEQSADWHGRMRRDLPRIADELDRLAEDPAMAHRLDLGRMRSAIGCWPARTPLSSADHPEFMFMRHAVGRAIAVARFVNQVEGRN